jgi:hypothetical protein
MSDFIAPLILIAAQILVSILGATGVSGGVVITLTGNYCIPSNPFLSGTNINGCAWTPGLPTVGNNIHCFFYDFSGATTFSASDNATPPNTYTANGAKYNGTGTANSAYQFFDSFAITHSPASSTDISNTMGNFTAGGGMCFESTGDTIVDSAVGTVSQASGTTINATAVPTGSIDLAECGVITPGGTTVTPGHGFSVLPAEPSSSLKLVYKILAASGSQTLSVDYSPSSAGDMICATYK